MWCKAAKENQEPPQYKRKCQRKLGFQWLFKVYFPLQCCYAHGALFLKKREWDWLPPDVAQLSRNGSHNRKTVRHKRRSRDQTAAEYFPWRGKWTKSSRNGFKQVTWLVYLKLPFLLNPTHLLKEKISSCVSFPPPRRLRYGICLTVLLLGHNAFASLLSGM